MRGTILAALEREGITTERAAVIADEVLTKFDTLTDAVLTTSALEQSVTIDSTDRVVDAIDRNLDRLTEEIRQNRAVASELVALHATQAASIAFEGNELRAEVVALRDALPDDAVFGEIVETLDDVDGFLKRTVERISARVGPAIALVLSVAVVVAEGF